MTFLNVLFSYIDDIYEAVSVHFKWWTRTRRYNYWMWLALLQYVEHIWAKSHISRNYSKFIPLAKKRITYLRCRKEYRFYKSTIVYRLWHRLIIVLILGCIITIIKNIGNKFIIRSRIDRTYFFFLYYTCWFIIEIKKYILTQEFHYNLFKRITYVRNQLTTALFFGGNYNMAWNLSVLRATPIYFQTWDFFYEYP
jgi:hypothetical protein